MSGWTLLDLLPGLYVLLLGVGLAAVLRRWYDPVPWRILAVFGLMIVALFPRVLFGGGVLLPLGNLPAYCPWRGLPPADPPSLALQADQIHQVTPWAIEVRRNLWDGRWPLWNAHAGAGMPLLADPSAQAFQPVVAATYPFPPLPGVGITAALRVLVALVFGFLFLRRQELGEAAALCGSLAFGWGGFLLLWLGWPMANNAALLPPVLYGIARCSDNGGARDQLLLFLTTASLLLSGHPETLVYALSFAGLFLLVRTRRHWRTLVRSGLTMALAGLAVAPVLLPILDYLPKTERAAAVAAALPPIRPVELWHELKKPEVREHWRKRAIMRLTPIVAPRAYGDHNFFWGSSNVVDDAGGFVSTAALLAVGAALLPSRGRRRLPLERVSLAVLVVSLLLIAQPPGFDRLGGRLPLLGATFIHQSHRILLLVSLCLAVLAACELERRTRGEGARWPVFTAAASLAVLITWGYFAHPNPVDPSLLAGYRHRLLALQLTSLILAAGLLAARPAARWGRAVPWLFCGLVAAELLLVHGPALPPAPKNLGYPVTPPVRFLLDHLGNDRLLGLGPWGFSPNFPLVYGLNDVRIDNPATPSAYGGATWPLRRKGPPHYFSRPVHPLYDFLGVRYVLTPPEAPLRRFKLVFSHPGGLIYRRPHPLPRLFLPAEAVIYRGDSWIDWLDANPDFARRALVQESPEGTSDWSAALPEASSLELQLPEPAHVHARAHLAETRLFASSIYHDGHWRLLVDGEPRRILLADGPFVAAWLPAGERRIDLLYRPGNFVLGCLLAALALAVAAAWWVPRPLTPPESPGSSG
jgi:hypothetical protein